MIRRELDAEVDKDIYYSDSKVVLGYIQNESRRLYVSVANHVQAIHNATEPSQWRYIDGAHKPVDLATRWMSPRKLMESQWMLGPEFLLSLITQPKTIIEETTLHESDPEVKREVTSYSTNTQKTPGFRTKRFYRFSSWLALTCTIGNLMSHKRTQEKKGETLQETKPFSISPFSRGTEASKPSNLQSSSTRSVHHWAEGFVFRRRKEDNTKRTTSTPTGPLHRSQWCPPCGRAPQRYPTWVRRGAFSTPSKGAPCISTNHMAFARNHHHQGQQITNGTVHQGSFWVVGAYQMIANSWSPVWSVRSWEDRHLPNSWQTLREWTPVLPSKMLALTFLVPGKYPPQGLEDLPIQNDGVCSSPVWVVRPYTLKCWRTWTPAPSAVSYVICSDNKVRRAKVVSSSKGSLKTYDRPIGSFILF